MIITITENYNFLTIYVFAVENEKPLFRIMGIGGGGGPIDLESFDSLLFETGAESLPPYEFPYKLTGSQILYPNFS